MRGESESVLTLLRRDVGRDWRRLLATDVVCRVAAFVLLVPLVGLLFHTFLLLAGKSVLTDTDILLFFLGPMGWVTVIAVGAVVLAIVAVKLAALMAIVVAGRAGRAMGTTGALVFAGHRAWPVLRVAVRVAARALLAAAPFLVLAGVVYATLLRKYDINYYLSQRPPEFLLAVALIAALAVALAVVLVRMLVRWLFAFPVLLFEGVPPGEALRVSEERSRPCRRALLRRLAAWVVAVAAASAAAAAVGGLLGRLLVPQAGGSLPVFILAVGVALLAGAALQFAVSVAAQVVLAALLVDLYHLHGGGAEAASRVPATAREEVQGERWRMSRPAAVVLLAIALLAAVAIGALALRNVRADAAVQIVAHRGASGAAPENTLAAVRRALEEKTDWVEIDVQESADGVVVVAHDSDLKKLGGPDGKIWEFTAAALKGVDIGRSYAPGFAGEGVPTLEEVLAACKGRAGVIIELKYYGHNVRLEERVVELVEAHGMQKDVRIMSLKYPGIQKARALRPDWNVGALVAMAAGDITKLDADFLAVNSGMATRSFIRNARKRGREVFAWTVNDPVQMSVLMGRGIDGIITDHPARAREVMAQRAAMTVVERLLFEVGLLLGAPTEEASGEEDA